VSEPGRRSLASEAAALAIGSLFTQGAAFVSVIVLARLLPKAELGGYQQLLLIYAIFSPLLIGGVPAALLYFLPRSADQDDRRRWVFDAYATLGLLGLAGTVALVLLRHPVAQGMSNDALAPALAAYAPFVLFSFVNAVMPNALIAQGMARRAAALNALYAVMWLVAVVVGAAVAETVESIAIALSIAAGVMSIVSIVAVIRNVGIERPRRLSMVRWRRLLGYGLPLALTAVVGMIGFQLDRFVVSANFAPAVFAVYAVGAVEVPIATLIRQSVNSVLVPAMSKHHAEGDLAGLAELWRGSIRKLSLFMLPIFVFLMVVADDLIHVLFGANFSESADIFRIYLFLVPIQIATWGLIPMAVGRPRINVGGSLVILVVNGALAVALVGPLGIKGPAIATPVAALCAVGYFLLRIKKIIDIPLRDLVPWRVVLLDFALAALAAVPAVGILALPVAPAVRLVLSGIVYLVVCVWLLRRTRQIDDLDWQRLVGILASVRRRPAAAG
jgi:O-antigen/teichoic acid export membrane protein